MPTYDVHWQLEGHALVDTPTADRAHEVVAEALDGASVAHESDIVQVDYADPRIRSVSRVR